MINSGPDGSAARSSRVDDEGRAPAVSERLAYPDRPTDRPTSGGYTQLHDGRSGLTWPRQEANLHGTRLDQRGTHRLGNRQTDRQRERETNRRREADWATRAETEAHGEGGDTEDVDGRLL